MRCAPRKLTFNWIRRYILFHNKRHPREMGIGEVRAFLAHLAVEEHVAASTQTQTLSALVFLYRDVLQLPLPEIDLQPIRAQKPRRLPTVLTRAETQRVLAQLSGTHLLMARLLYGSGLHLMECLRLRVKDLDFELYQITVREGKGDTDRVTMLPQKVVPALQEHLIHVRALHQQDLEHGHGCVYLPDALERKYPNACKEWGWQFIFPSERISKDPRSGVLRRHHIHESSLQKAARATAHPNKKGAKHFSNRSAPIITFHALFPC